MSSPLPGSGGWSDRTAVVTGASRGIGRAAALELSGAGAQVALVARDVRRLHEVADACDDVAPVGTPRATVWPVDLTDGPATDEAAGHILDHLGGRLDLLANVAGSSLRHAPLEELTEADWSESLALNLLAAVRLQRACFPALATARGAIVNVGSVVAGSAAVLGGPYAAAKAALASLTRSSGPGTASVPPPSNPASWTPTSTSVSSTRATPSGCSLESRPAERSSRLRSRVSSSSSAHPSNAT